MIAENEEYFTFEVGSVLPSTLNEIKTTKYDLLSVSQIGYLMIKDSKIMHIFWGSLNDIYNERTSYLFGEIGYEKKIKDSPYYLDFSLGIGRVDLNSHYLSTKNMFTERISFGFKNFYTSIRLCQMEVKL